MRSDPPSEVVIMATFIEWNGKETEFRPTIPERGFTRDELSEILRIREASVEFISLADGRLMVVDGDNYRTRGPVNVKATKLFTEGGRPTGLAIVGSVIVGCPGEIS
jgi:hypothetical protein